MQIQLKWCELAMITASRSSTTTMSWDEIISGNGRSLLARFLLGDGRPSTALLNVFEALDEGAFDDNLATTPNPEKVHVTTSCHLMALALRYRLEGMTAASFYKGDPLRYVRTNLLVQRLLGFERLTLGWPVYAFGAEALGQTMMYPPDQAPGSDPGRALVRLEDPASIPAYNPDCEIAAVVEQTLIHMARISGIEPVAHLPAPYSLAADIAGQETVIMALSTSPETVSVFLDRLVDKVLRPWCDDLARKVPNVWLELSDASGSPMFIGPRHFLERAVAPVERLIGENPWGDRVFVANYRGDSVPIARSRGRVRSRPQGQDTAISFDALTEAKKTCCPIFITRLEADSVDVDTYTEFAIRQGMSLYAGIGATRLDRNSVTDKVAQRRHLSSDARALAGHVLRARSALDAADRLNPAWPGDIYVEDTNAETDLDLLEAVFP
jgi:hypothetical protein